MRPQFWRMAPAVGGSAYQCAALSDCQTHCRKSDDADAALSLASSLVELVRGRLSQAVVAGRAPISNSAVRRIRGCKKNCDGYPLTNIRHRRVQCIYLGLLRRRN